MRRLREIRLQRGLSIKDLAAVTGLAPTTFYSLEDENRPAIDGAKLVTALRIARALGCAPEELVEDQEQLLF